MKILRDILRVLSVVLAAAVVVLFFFTFANLTTDAGTAQVSGAQLAFSGDVSSYFGQAEGTFSVYKSGWYFISFILSAATLLFTVLGFKFSKSNGAATVFGVLNVVLFIVLISRSPAVYIDYGNLAVTSITMSFYRVFAMIAAIASLLLCVAGVLVNDRILVAASNGAKKTIPARVVRFLRDYKGELKKVVWPTGRSVVKNTIVVLIMCAIALLFIWLVDMGMGALFNLVFGVSAA